jgi:hypothetical protein
VKCWICKPEPVADQQTQRKEPSREAAPVSRNS